MPRDELETSLQGLRPRGPTPRDRRTRHGEVPGTIAGEELDQLGRLPEVIVASKWALECAGEALAHEVRRFGIRVVNVQPGVVMTSIFENSAEATRYDKTSPYQPIMRRNGKLFAAGFRDPARPEDVAETILAAITSGEYRLRWLVGKDAVGLAEGRARMSDEAWVAMGDDLSDEEYNRRFFEQFGIRL